MQVGTVQDTSTCNLTQGQQLVVASAGVDWSLVKIGWWFKVLGDTQPWYTVGSTPVVVNGHWQLNLTGNYLAASNPAASYVIILDYTDDGQALIAPNDTEKAAIQRRNATKISSNFGTVKAASDAATAQAATATQLALAGPADLRSLNRLALIGQTDQTASSQAAAADFALSASFIESWSNLSAWSANGVQVSNGKLYGVNNPPGVTAAHHAFPVAQNSRLRFHGSFTIPAASSGSGGLAMIGLNLAAPGSAPQAGAPQTYALGILTDTNALKAFCAGNYYGVVDIVNGGSATPTLAAGTYYVWIVADEFGLNFYLCNAAHTLEYVFLFNWAAGPSYVSLTTIGAICNLAVFNSDPRGTSGIGIGPLGARQSTATVASRAGIEDLAPTTYTVVPSASDGYRVQLPASYDSRKPSPVLMYFHGASQDEQAPMSDPLSRAFFQAFSAAGFAILSSRGANNYNMGNQASLDSYLAAYRYYRDHFSLGLIAALSESMGGLAGLVSLAGRQMPLVAAWAGIYPVCNLAAFYTNPTFTGYINNAYSITGSNPYATATAGHDPLLLAQANPAAFRGLPMRFYASTADTVVPRATNTNAFQALVAPVAPESTIIPCTGDHGDPSHFQAADLIAFYRRYLPG